MSDKPEGLILKDNGGDFVLVPEDTYLAVCVHIIDLGVQNTTFQGQPRQDHQVLFTWELPTQKMEDGRPFVQSRTYTASLSKKANLRKDLQAWRGANFTDEEVQGFDLRQVLGKWCLLGIVHKESGDRTYTNVSSIAKLPKEMLPLIKQNKVHNEFIYFDFAKFDADELEKCPDWVKQKVHKSLDMQTIENGYEPTDEDIAEVDQDGGPNSDNDIPF